MALIEKVREFVEEHGLSGKPGIVAVSGGPDSVALLRALHELQVPITVAHVNHQLRGEESDADEEFVRDLASKLNVRFVSTRIVLPADENLEAAARKARYVWLGSLEGNWIATGHTLDDQTETVLHHIIRGTGLHGIRGIGERLEPSRYCAKQVVRPLLSLHRSNGVEYLESLGQPYRVDSSNADLSFTRNRLRHDVLPKIREINPSFDVVLGNLAEQSREVMNHLTVETAKLHVTTVLPRARAILIINRLTFQDAPQFIRRELLRTLWQLENWPLSDMTYDHWNRLANLEPGDYPGGIRLTLTERVVQLGPRQ